MNLSRRKYSDFILYAAIVALVAVVGIVATNINDRRFINELRFSLFEKSNTLRAELERELIGKITMSRGLVASIASNPDLSQDRFSVIADQLRGNNLDILNIAAAPDLVVKFVYPFAKNSSVMGFDYRTSDAQLAAVLTAKETRRTVIAGPVNLVQGGSGLIIRSPVFVADTFGAEQFWGIVSVVVDMETFQENAGVYDTSTAFDVAIRGKDSTGSEGEVFFGDPRVFSAQPVVQSVTLPAGSWQIAMAPRGGWPNHADNFILLWLIVSAVGAFVLVVVFVLRKNRGSKELAEKQLNQAVEAIDGGFSLFDADDKLVMCNSVFRAINQKSADILKPGVAFEDLLRSAVDQGQFPEAVGKEDAWIAERMSDHNSEQSEVVHRFNDDHWLKISERKMPDGSTVGLRIDVTELKLAKDAAGTAIRAKTDFLNNISHELRTPLTVILGYSSFLTRLEKLPSHKGLMSEIEDPNRSTQGLNDASASLTNEVSKYAKQVESSGQHLLHMINDVLDISQIEDGTLELNRKQLSIAPIFKSMADQFSIKAAQKKINILTDCNGDQVFADEARLRQTLYNLIGNAVKFTDSGEIRLSADTLDGKVTFSVQDTGSGIAEKDQKNLFERFMQLDPSETRAADGTGLGLAICKNLVELHGGSLHLSSTLGEGSTFSFEIASQDASVIIDNTDGDGSTNWDRCF